MCVFWCAEPHAEKSLVCSCVRPVSIAAFPHAGEFWHAEKHGIYIWT